MVRCGLDCFPPRYARGRKDVYTLPLFVMQVIVNCLYIHIAPRRGVMCAGLNANVKITLHNDYKKRLHVFASQRLEVAHKDYSIAFKDFYNPYSNIPEYYPKCR